MPNALINETSPYLLQHAHNPVEWLPWGPEAFARAQAEDKPVLVSIGYAACHWCHVMERESFEDAEIARKMNERVVAVKVDREERPDVDAIYMEAVQRLHGHGGWPLNVFLMPDGRPFYGGTYFPPTDRSGMPSWPRVIDAVADAYRDHRDDVASNARILTDSIRTSTMMDLPDAPLDAKTLDEAYLHLAEAFDPARGGFGGAPKFPQAMPLEFLLAYYVRTGEEQAREMADISMERMADGGIYDHLGGGFARYSTDALWLVPHFEKMLYDNALLASLYLAGWKATGDPRRRAVVEETLDYLLRDLRHADGAFFSSQDADSEGVEGKYYVWSQAEIEEMLGDGAAAFIRYYGVTRLGNFEGRNILHVADSAARASADLGLTLDELTAQLAPMRRTLLAERVRRVPPATDDKALAAWNGLALRALADAAFAFDRADYRDAAVRNAEFVLRELRRGDGRLLRSWREGQAGRPGYLEDYALLVDGLLALHTATFSHRWLAEAVALADAMLALFRDPESGVFYDVGADHEELIVRPRNVFDNAVPSGGSAAAEALLRLAVVTGDDAYRAEGERLLRSAAPLAARYPLGFGNWLRAFELALAPPLEIVVVGEPDAADTRALLAPLRAQPLPTAVVVCAAPDDPHYFPTPLTAGRLGASGARAHVCRGYVCDLPAADAAAFAAQLGALRGAGRGSAWS